MCNCRVQQVYCLALTNSTLFWRQGRDLDQIVEQNSKYAGLVWRESSFVEKCRHLFNRSWLAHTLRNLFRHSTYADRNILLY